MSSDLTITRLSITPVKGLSLHHPDAIDLTVTAPQATGCSTSWTTPEGSRAARETPVSMD